jgi:hypothetical protein
MPSLKRRMNARMMQLSDVAVFEEPEQKDECIGQLCFCLSLTRCLLHLGLGVSGHADINRNRNST